LIILTINLLYIGVILPFESCCAKIWRYSPSWWSLSSWKPTKVLESGCGVPIIIGLSNHLLPELMKIRFWDCTTCNHRSSQIRSNAPTWTGRSICLQDLQINNDGILLFMSDSTCTVVWSVSICSMNSNTFSYSSRILRSISCKVEEPNHSGHKFGQAYSGQISSWKV